MTALSMLERLLKFSLPAYLLAYFLAAFFWRSFVVWKRIGVNPLVFKGSDNAHDYIGRVFKLPRVSGRLHTRLSPRGRRAPARRAESRAGTSPPKS